MSEEDEWCKCGQKILRPDGFPDLAPTHCLCVRGQTSIPFQDVVYSQSD